MQHSITPQQCRLRDMTYAAPITVDIEYTRGKEVVVKRGRDGVGGVTIGKMPLMLRSDRWVMWVTLGLQSLGKVNVRRVSSHAQQQFSMCLGGVINGSMPTQQSCGLF